MHDHLRSITHRHLGSITHISNIRAVLIYRLIHDPRNKESSTQDRQAIQREDLAES